MSVDAKAPVESPEVKEILVRYRDVWAIYYGEALIGWDMETYMPAGASAERGEARATLRKLVQRLLTHPEFVTLVESVDPKNDFERGVIRVLKRDIEYFTKLPPEFVEEEAKVTTKAFLVWREAKERDDFERFAPLLEKVFELQRRKAEYLGYEDHPYDALLDRFEEGLTVKDCERIFSVVDRLSDLFKRIIEGRPREHSLEREAYDERDMKRLNEHILYILGYDFSRGRMDVSAHPFTQGIGLDDVRITTWYHGRDFRRSLLAVMHEFGHAAYDLNIDRAYWATPVQQGASLGVHESQSRFWENVVGRSMEFVEATFDEMVLALPFLRRYSPSDVYEYFTLVRPELIRVEADEVHYGLHIYLRYEIERRAMESELGVKELPEFWSEEMERLIGIEPKGYADGVLQDVHWSLGYVGYFPTYFIGTVLSAQIASKIPDLSEKIAQRRFKEIMEFLRERIQKWGAVYPPKELVRRALGEDLDPERFLDYARRKYLA